MEVLSRNLYRTEENYENPAEIAGVPTKIRSEHHPNRNLERHRYDILTGFPIRTENVMPGKLLLVFASRAILGSESRRTQF
jgi:hypothetical protein